MTGVELVLAIVKILIVIMFLLNMAAISTWADRRQAAMVQDRVGPNRAVVFLPSNLVRVIVLLPPSLFGVIAVFTATRELAAPLAIEAMVLGTQLAILVAWLSLIVLCGAARGGPINAAEKALAGVDPRTIFYAGVMAHVLGFFVTQAVPQSAAPAGARVANALLGLLLFVAGVYAASRVSDGPIPLRVAGLLHAAADAIKMIWKEDFIPKRADRLLHGLAPILAVFPALVTFAVIPFGDSICFADNGDGVFGFSDLPLIKRTVTQSFECTGGHVVNLQVADLNVGILYLFAMAGTGVIGAALAGWASDNKFSLLGGLRAASQMVSYEVAMGLSLVGLFIIYGSVRLGDMVQWQGQNAWGVFVQPFAFFLFLASLTAETKRIPFDQPEGESEIVAGYYLEYSGMKFGMFMTGEYVELITSSALLVTLFFGGYQLPFLHRDGITIAFGDTALFQYKMTHLAVSVTYFLAFFGKTILMTWAQIFFRWTLPRFRYDQVMRLGWTKLLPFAIGNMLVTAILVLAIDSAPAGLQDGLKVAAQVSQAVIALGGFAAVVVLIAGLLEPVDRKRFVQSTAARFAVAAGGTKSSPQQA